MDAILAYIKEHALIVIPSVAGGVVLISAAVVWLIMRTRRRSRRLAAAPIDAALRVANIHHIGKRGNQQDFFGVSDLSDSALRKSNGVLAVVADGMGGLSGGAEISAIAVSYMLSAFQRVGEPYDTCVLLLNMVTGANAEIMNFLGDNGGMSGSTVVAAVIKDNGAHFISVGDSRICLLRGGTLITLNREHTYAGDLDRMAARDEISREQAQSDPQRGSLTSYLGMGARLEHIDRSARPLPLIKSDRLLLMTDGVFNALSDGEIVDALSAEDIYAGAARLESAVLSKDAPHQDNFTAIIVEIGG